MVDIKTENKKTSGLFIYILLFSCIVAILFSFYNFYIKKDYNFYIEAKCNPSEESCFYRDCENNPEICPINNFSYYNQYVIEASDYAMCKKEDCSVVCQNQMIYCKKIECTEGDVESGVCTINPLINKKDSNI